MKFRIRYRRARFTVEGKKPSYCKACGREKAEGWKIELHHWKYAYSTKMVRKNPQLALDYTIPFCYQCHKLADAIKNMMKDRFRFNRVMTALRYAAIQRKKDELNV